VTRVQGIGEPPTGIFLPATGSFRSLAGIIDGLESFTACVTSQGGRRRPGRCSDGAACTRLCPPCPRLLCCCGRGKRRRELIMEMFIASSQPKLNPSPPDRNQLRSCSHRHRDALIPGPLLDCPRKQGVTSHPTTHAPGCPNDVNQIIGHRKVPASDWCGCVAYQTQPRTIFIRPSQLPCRLISLVSKYCCFDH
jgi:hypothetical protein